MKYQFEHKRFNVCGDCPCWCPDEIRSGWASNNGGCYIDLEERKRFDAKPKDCPLKEVEV